MPEVSRGDVFVANLEPVQGSEVGGRRPVVVVSRDVLSHCSPVVVVCAITDAVHKKKFYHPEVPVGVGGLTKDSIVICEQVRAISKTRLCQQLGRFDRGVMASIDTALKIALDLP
jgi:mRNA interferase MazF